MDYPKIKKWRKVLYQDQGLPDNYTDESFLIEMKKNLYVRHYTYLQLLLDTGRIVQQISSVAIFIMCYNLLEIPNMHFFVDIVSLSITSIFCLGLKLSKSGHIPLSIQSLLIFYLATFILAPILRTLTDTISTDTIYAMTSVSLLFHLLLHDYSTNQNQIPGVVSFNAAIFATVCLASRLETNSQAFALVMLSVKLFAVWPTLRKSARSTMPIGVDVGLTILFVICGTGLMTQSSMAHTVLLICVLIFVTFICPVWLLSLQSLKNNIHGPWDEAVISG